MDRLISALTAYKPFDESEKSARAFMTDFAQTHPDCLLRDNKTAHFTASAWIVNKQRDKVLMVFHNIYNAWSWTGGHADGEEDMLSVSRREASEETGITALSLLDDGFFSVEVLNVAEHVKRGKTVKAHKHLNCTFLFEADDSAKTQIKKDENSAVAWLSLDDAENTPEEQMRLIYKKLNRKLKNYE